MWVPSLLVTGSLAIGLIAITSFAANPAGIGAAAGAAVRSAPHLMWDAFAEMSDGFGGELLPFPLGGHQQQQQQVPIVPEQAHQGAPTGRGAKGGWMMSMFVLILTFGARCGQTHP